MKKIIFSTINTIQQKTAQIILIGLFMLFVALSSLYLVITVITSI